ncbi:hypothetical protein BGZ95_010432 [Linnemannia exigua]|uniref:Uncharacterized protein n=1 Tax=Linnemannia exigua TaxID=604196 RepID=A0AAD4DNP7_9FUNG|nr:hypothetical protein BGZ95_010432 [Linnemannia exigua]
MDIEDFAYLPCKPKATHFNPITLRNLKPGSIKEWCTCGLTKTGVWCDGKSHKGTSFKPLRWQVPKQPQTIYLMCDCRYTTRPPYCDGLHMDLPLKYFKRIQECPKQPHDPEVTKLCEECGWAGPRDKWPELPETDSEGSDLSDEDDSEEGDSEARRKKVEEDKARTLAANTPKVQIQLQTDQDASVSSSSSQATVGEGSDKITVEVQRGCSGACRPRHQDTGDEAVAKVTDDLNKTSLSL